MNREEELADAAEVRKHLGGSDDDSILSVEDVGALWAEYSKDFDAHWLIVSRLGLDNFTGWLCGALLDERKRVATTIVPLPAYHDGIPCT